MVDSEDRAHKEQQMVLLRINFKLQAALAMVQGELGLSESDHRDLNHAFMIAAGGNIAELVKVNRGKRDVLAKIGKGLEEQQPSVSDAPSLEESLAIAEGILTPQGVTLQQLQIFYTHQERSIIARGLNEQAEGASSHPVIARVLGIMFSGGE